MRVNKVKSVRKFCKTTLLSALVCLLATPHSLRAQPNSSSHERLQALAKSIIFDSAKERPLTATFLGLSDEDGRLDAPSVAANEKDLAEIHKWQQELAAIPLDGAPLSDVDDAKLLRAQLLGAERQYTVYKTYEKDPSAPSLTILNAIYTQFMHLPVAGTAGATKEDVAAAWQKITDRLSAAPKYIVAGNALVTHPGRLYGISGSKQLAEAPGFLSGPLTDAAKQQLPTDRFAKFTTARDATIAAMNDSKKFIDEHVASWPENHVIGRAAYDALLRDEQLLPFDSADIERLGRDELAHGWAVQFWMEQLAAERKTPIGPQTGGGIAPGGPALIDYYRARIAALREFVEKHQVVDVPEWLGQIQVVETPKFLQPVSPGASMNPAAAFQQSGERFLLHYSADFAGRSC